jgi:uncharacterized protein
VSLFREAAEQGDGGGQHNLGTMYEQGKGLPQDYAEAVRWYRRAAVQGNANAQHSLGLMYAQGQGLPQDYVQAAMWFILAAALFPEGRTEITRSRTATMLLL